jgi:hypothetical protein
MPITKAVRNLKHKSVHLFSPPCIRFRDTARRERKTNGHARTHTHSIRLNVWTVSHKCRTINASNSNSKRLLLLLFIIISGDGTKSTRYCGHFWPIVLAPDDRWGWLWSSRWNEDWQGKPKYLEKTCPSATLSTANPTWPDPGSNPGRRGGKPATNRLSYGAALVNTLTKVLGLSVRQSLEYPEKMPTVVSTLELETNEWNNGIT